MLEALSLTILFACWGSFLNVVAYRLIHANLSSIFFTRSYCPHCKHAIAWYDNIPIVSWFLLNGRCRKCAASISWLYPFIELLTIASLWVLYVTQPHEYFFSYAFFFSALIITIRTDLETMLISRFVTLFLIPTGVFASYFAFIPINWQQSVIGTLTAYCLLHFIGILYYRITGRIGMGEGDAELLAFIGSYTGLLGWWYALMLGSLVGSIIGIALSILQKKNIATTKLPFGPFLAFGAMTYIIAKPYLLHLFHI